MAHHDKHSADLIAKIKRKLGKASYAEIAEQLGLSRNVVAGIMFRQRHGTSNKVRLGRPTKLTADDVRAIREIGDRRLKRGELAALCEKYGVAPSSIHSVRRGNSWAQV